METSGESGRAARLRGAVDRLHAAQLAALATCQAAGRDAYGAERQLLEQVGEMGCLLVRLPGARAEAAELRRELVALAVAGANTLAELVSLAFEVESAEECAEAEAGRHPPGGERVAAPPAAGGGGGSNGASPPARAPTSMRAVTDTNRLLVEQLKRLMQHVERQESWRSTRPGELWRGLVAQVAGLFPLVAGLEAGALCEAEAKELRRLAADAANYVAFIRFYPRVPTA